jgi:hypothetical protein
MGDRFVNDHVSYGDIRMFEVVPLRLDKHTYSAITISVLGIIFYLWRIRKLPG